ncbi:unnamed protein product [Protopolystoma xenopodis]|uniref:Uncharacterized protein n=1 Tax=Protopolystoma xenopodis TaxID=117903 RepID=A0A3S5C878_9PLAT|nr:unnamed protein product [Protopolystoma xenopodis]
MLRGDLGPSTLVEAGQPGGRCHRRGEHFVARVWRRAAIGLAPVVSGGGRKCGHRAPCANEDGVAGGAVQRTCGWATSACPMGEKGGEVGRDQSSWCRMGMGMRCEDEKGTVIRARQKRENGPTLGV